MFNEIADSKLKTMCDERRRDLVVDKKITFEQITNNK